MIDFMAVDVPVAAGVLGAIAGAVLPSVAKWACSRGKKGGEEGGGKPWWYGALKAGAGAAAGWGASKLAGKAGLGQTSSGYSEPWKGAEQDRKSMFDLARGRAEEKLPYMPGYAPKRQGLINAEDARKARAQDFLTQGYAGLGNQGYKTSDLSRFGVDSNVVPERGPGPDYAEILNRTGSPPPPPMPGTSSPGAAPPGPRGMKPGPGTITGGDPRVHNPENLNVRPTISRMGGIELGDPRSRYAPGNEGSMYSSDDVRYASPTGGAGGGDIGSDVASGVNMDKLISMHGFSAVERYFRERGMSIPQTM